MCRGAAGGAAGGDAVGVHGWEFPDFRGIAGDAEAGAEQWDEVPNER